jgi:tRNA(Met) C34 N-acetyltransferase TmcA
MTSARGCRVHRQTDVRSSHRKKREAKIKRDVKRGIREPNEQDPFEIFVAVTDIRYTCADHLPDHFLLSALT